MIKHLFVILAVFLYSSVSAQVKSISLCPGTNTAISVHNVQQKTYQWQTQLGNTAEFLNLSNNSTYSGVFTNTLSISNAPSSMYGNLYRCLITDLTGTVSGDTTALLFETTWVGTQNNSWHNAANWDCGIIPDSQIDVVIPAGICVVNQNATCRSLKVANSASLQVLSGYDVNISSSATPAHALKTNVHLIDSTVFKLNMDTVKLNQGIYEFSHATGAPGFSVNEIILGSVGDGFVRKITSLSSQANKTILQTEQAGLDDVFEKAKFAFDINTDASGMQTASKINATQQTTTGGYTFDLAGTTLLESGVSKLSIETGTINLNANWVFDVDYSDGQLKGFKMGATGIGYSSDLSLKAEIGSGFSFNKSGSSKKIKKTKIVYVPVPAGPVVVPIPIVVSLFIDLRYTASVDAQASISRNILISSNHAVDLEIAYKSNNWQNTYGATGSTNVSATNRLGEASLEINSSIRPYISVSFNGLGGPYASLAVVEQAKGNFSASGNSNLWDFYAVAHIETTVGAQAKILSKVLVSTSKTWITDPIYYRTPDTIKVAAGNNQEGDAGIYLAQPVKVKVVDNLGFTQRNVQVFFNVTSGGGLVEDASALTDANGIAFTRWKLGANTTTPQKMEAIAKRADGSAISGAPVEFVAVYTQPYSVTATAGDYQLGTANQNLANPLEVVVKDVNGIAMENIKVEWSVAKGDGTITNLITYTNANGKSINTWKLGPTGEQVVKVVVKKSSGVDVVGSPLLFSADLPGMTIVAGGNGGGAGLNQFKDPQGIYVDEAGSVYVADTRNYRIMKWAKGGLTGEVLLQTNNTQFTSLFVDGDSLLFGAQSGASVSKMRLGSTPNYSTNVYTYYAGQGVYGFSVDKAGYVYTVQGEFYHQVQKFSNSSSPTAGANERAYGVTVAGTGTAGSAANLLNQPWDVWIDSLGNMYIADALNYRIQKWAPGATSGVTVAGGNGRGPALNQFTALAVCADNNGSVYVPDRYNYRILKFAPGSTNGVVIAGGSLGTGLNQLNEPYDIFIRGIYLYVCDKSNNRIMRMRY